MLPTLAPSRTSPVSLRTLLKVLLFIALTLPAVFAQDVTVSLNQDAAVFSDNNEDFERICHYTGSSAQFDHLEWLLNGTVRKTGVVQNTNLQLLIQPITFDHAGRWECRAVFSDSTVSSPVNAGVLTVFDPNDITAPPQQYALADQNYTLQCSSIIQGSFIAWLRNTVILSSGRPLTISAVQLSHEEEYDCRVSIMGTSFTKLVQLNVIVPPRIFSQPQFDDQSAFTNEQVTLTVTFQSHQEVNTTVKWFKNNIAISSSNVTTRYGPAPNATTELHFEQITRENRGRYRVEIENTAEVIPDEMRAATSTFDVDVKVPPSRPTGVMVTPINNTHIRIGWTLTNRTADAGAEVLTLHLQDHPNSPFQLDPNQVEWILCSEPGMMFNLTLKAMNPDGVAATDPMAVKLPATAPSVERFRALRVNDTAFNFTLEVFYTGGGDLEQFSIRLQQSGSGTFNPLATVAPTQSQTSPRLWYAVVTNSAFENPEEPIFDINIVNAMGQSTVKRVMGEVVLPGRPSILFISRSSDSLTLQIQLSDIGTAPILSVEVNATLGSQLISTIEKSGSFIQRELIDITVSDLQPSTTYVFRTRAVNEHGTGAGSMEFPFTTDMAPRTIPPWAIIAIAVGGSVVLTVLCITAVFCLICCCKKSCCNREYTEKYYTGGGHAIGTMPEEIKTSAETLNSTSHRGSVRGGVIGNYTSVNLSPRSPTIESCVTDSPYIKHRFESVTDSDGSRSDIHSHQPCPTYRHYTYSHSPGPIGTVPAPINLHHHDRLSRSLTAFDEPTSPQDITHQATMV